MAKWYERLGTQNISFAQYVELAKEAPAEILNRALIVPGKKFKLFTHPAAANKLLYKDMYDRSLSERVGWVPAKTLLERRKNPSPVKPHITLEEAAIRRLPYVVVDKVHNGNPGTLPVVASFKSDRAAVRYVQRKDPDRGWPHLPRLAAMRLIGNGRGYVQVVVERSRVNPAIKNPDLFPGLVVALDRSISPPGFRVYQTGGSKTPSLWRHGTLAGERSFLDMHHVNAAARRAGAYLDQRGMRYGVYAVRYK